MIDEAPLNLEAATASKVLQADLRNSVAAVAAGQRIPKADRDRLETSILTSASPETIAQLSKERQANLLKIWANGRRRLTPAELKEIEHLLPRASPPPSPPTPPIAQPATFADPPPPVAVPSSEPEPALVLTASPAIKLSRLGYQYDLAHYEPIFNASNRTLKGWLAIGRSATPPELPPYDAPERMADWYARHKKNRVPDHLVQLAAQAARLENSTQPAPATAAAQAAGAVVTLPQGQPPSATTPGSTPAVPIIATGFSATLERLRNAEAAAGAKYTQLILDGKDAEAEAQERRWQKLRGDLRDYERDAEKVLSAQGKLWPADEVAAGLYELHTVLIQSFESLYSRIETELRTLPREDAKRLYLAEVRRMRAGLVANKFTSAPIPEPLAA